MASADIFRGEAYSMRMSGPPAHVAGLLGKEDRWRQGLVQVWHATPPTKRLKLPGLGSRDKYMAQECARTLHDLLPLGFAWWTGWTIPTLWTLSWLVNAKAAISPRTSRCSARVNGSRSVDIACAQANAHTIHVLVSTHICKTMNIQLVDSPSLDTCEFGETNLDSPKAGKHNLD